MDRLGFECFVLNPTTHRGTEWCKFALKVLNHCESYTVPQYGDKPNDQAETFTPGDCAKHCARYSNRFGQNSREGQDLLDPIKVAHYSCLWEAKLQEELSKAEEDDGSIVPDEDIYAMLSELLIESDVTDQEMDDLVTLFKMNKGS